MNNLRMKFNIRTIALITVLSALVSFPSQAAMVQTTEIAYGQTSLTGQPVTGQREWLMDQLVIGGVEKSKAQQRVSAMTDLQVAEIYQRIDENPAGGNTLLILVLILVITELTGYTDIIAD